MKIAAILCTEPQIEQQSILLVRSIRRFAGSLADMPIFSFAPRPDHFASDATISELRSLGVMHKNYSINMQYGGAGAKDKWFGLANKPFVCAYAEQTIPAEVLVFLDSDTVILNEPTLLLLDAAHDVAASPVHVRNIGVHQLVGGTNEQYWSSLYHACNVRPPVPLVRTAIDRADVFQYFNSGVISARRTSEVFARWATNFRTVMELGICPTEALLIEQSVFAATVTATTDRVKLLPVTYNYPIGSRELLPQEEQLELTNMVLMHYRGHFAKTSWRATLAKIRRMEAGTSVQYRWLVDNLSELAYREP